MEPARQVDDDHENEPASKANLRAIEGGGQTTDPRSGHLQPVSQPENSVYDKNDEKAVVRPDLKKQEETGAVNSNGTPGDSSKNQKNESPGKASQSSTASQVGGNQESPSSKGGGLYNEEGDQDSSRIGRLRSKAKRSSKSKWFIGGALGATSMLTILIIALIILAGAYKIVDFAEHVAAYQFARVTGQMSEDSTNITKEAVDLDAVPDDDAGNSLIASLKDKYDTATGQVGDLWSKLDNYRPDKVISNFQNDGTLKLNTSTTKLGRTRIDSVSINDDESGINSTAVLDNSFKSNHIPGFKFNSDFQFSRDFAPDLLDALEANSIGPITRARIASQIREELGIGLIGWVAGKYSGKSEAAADAEVERQSTAAAEGQDLTLFDDPSGENTDVSTATDGSPGIDKAAADIQTQLNKDVTENAGQIAANPNQTPSDVASSLTNDVESEEISGLTSGTMGDILGAINPVYKYAVPLCLIYDGSLQKAGPTINEQSDQLEREAVWTQAAASQEKDGTSANGEAVGAVDWKLGDITKSNAEMRSSGLPVNTSTTLSTESSPTGQTTYSIANYLGSVGDLINDVGPICPALTNLYVGVGLGVANLGYLALSAIFTGGSGDAAEVGGEGALEATLDSQLGLFDASEYSADTASDSPSLLSRIMGKAENAGSYAKDFTKDTAKQVVTIGGLTLLAKQLVAAEMGGSHSPTATGQSYDNGVDDGTNLYANQIEQRQFYGAPMTDANLGSDNTANQAQLASDNSRGSIFDRYASVSNPNSLVSDLAIKVDGYANGSIISSLVHLLGGILSPLQSMGNLFSSISSKTASATTPITSDNTYYGNVQFGFTQQEKALLDSCPQDSHDTSLCSYQPLENQLILDKSGNEDAIASKYGECFTDSIGTLLSNGDIMRNQDGDVISNQGLCSPDNLGSDSPDPLAIDNDITSPNHSDMIFRWRVAQGYNNTLDQLTDEQTVTGSGNDTNNSGANNGPCSSAINSSSSSTSTPYFTTIDDKVCDQNGNVFVPYGTSIVDDLDQTDWNTTQNQQATDAQIQASAEYWNVNTIRIQVSEDNFMQNPSPGLNYNLAAMQRLKTEVDEIINLGKIPIINDNLERTTATQLGPNAQTEAFWISVTSYFSDQNNPSYQKIIFDIFNEPSDGDWSVWHSGGNGYIGMQNLVNSIRQSNNSLSNNLIWVEGPYYATRLDEINQYPINSTNIVYAYHHVDFTQPQAIWEKQAGLNLGNEVPIVEGEWAQYESSKPECYTNGPGAVSSYLSTLQSDGVGVIFWSLEPGVGTEATTPAPVTSILTSNFPTSAADYSQPNTFNNVSSYSCTDTANGDLPDAGVGSDIMSYFQQYSGNE